MKEHFQELELLIHTRGKTELLSYDTTFELGPYYFYFSVCFTFSAHLFYEHPDILAAFFIHEAKRWDIHKLLFSSVNQNVIGLENKFQ